MIKRVKNTKIPVQGNVYPVPSLMYIEDDVTRLNLLSGQPLGGTSLKSGVMDIFLDRRLLQDDSRGLGQGVTDNRRTKEVFKIVFETKPNEPLKPSLKVNDELLELLHPPFLMFSPESTPRPRVDLMTKSLPCGYHLLNVRASDTLALFHLTVHRMAISCDTLCVNGGAPFKLSELFSEHVLEKLQATFAQTSLSLMYELKKNLSLQTPLALEEIDFGTYAMKLRP